MYLIGLTGGIASGKSTVSTMLQELGAYIIDADKLAHEITKPHKRAWQEIVAAFGSAVTDANGQINRKRLGKIIFADAAARAQLEAITHPRIEEEVAVAMTTARQQGCEIIVLDAPLLIEVGWYSRVNAVWVVFVDENTQIVRLMMRDNSSYEDAMARIRAQLSLSEKLKYADVVINNSKTIGHTKKQVHKFWCEISKTMASGNKEFF
ncbi:dephospho-CoA kinase [Sporomusa termitida]|uniref:Dephospho-CoA kinase n=1 Tax=Sporomusa termitida TaxID=2377 RepID=A0A517DUH8_9FIRM|nr:dephospho-CoA kinase [Sporomusa termitida]QDR80997.1 Dephospho-CoA kinase [Sporomusa termitida]